MRLIGVFMKSPLIRSRKLVTSMICYVRTQAKSEQEAEPSNVEAEEEFLKLELMPKKKDAAEEKRRKAFIELTSGRHEIQPPRWTRMTIDQDWPSVWPTAASFKSSVVPLPIRMGYQKKWWRDPPPPKHGNLELMKIPNFLHLTPNAIQRRHCNAVSLRMYCTSRQAATVPEKQYNDLMQMYKEEVETKAAAERELTEVNTQLLGSRGLLSVSGVMKVFEEKMATRFKSELFDEDGAKIAADFGTRAKGKTFEELPRKIKWRISYEMADWRYKRTGEQSLKQLVEYHVKKYPTKKISRFCSRCAVINETNIGEIAESLFELFDDTTSGAAANKKRYFNSQWSNGVLLISDIDAMTDEQRCLLLIICRILHVYHHIA